MRYRSHKVTYQIKTHSAEGLTRLVPLYLFFRETWPRQPAAQNTKLQTEAQRGAKKKNNSQALKFTLRGELPRSQKSTFLRVRCATMQAKNRRCTMESAPKSFILDLETVQIQK